MTESQAGQAGAGSTSSAAAPARPATVPQQASQHPEASPRQSDGGWHEPEAGAEEVPRGDPILAAAARASWAAVLLGGLCMIAAGIALLVWPHASLTVVAVVIGLALVLSGLVRLYEGFTARAESGGMRAAYVVIGLLALLAGLYFLRHHALSILLVAFVTGVYFIMHGIADIGVAISTPLPGRGLRAVLGVFALAAGLVMLIWPAVTLVLLLTIVGAWLLFYGGLLILTAFGMRRAVRKLGAAASPRLAAST